MYYSSLFVFNLVIVVSLSLCGADVNRDPLNSNYKIPPYNGRQDEVINYGNGYNRHNVVVLDQNPSNAGTFQRGGSNPDALGNRFGSATHNVPQPKPGQPRRYPGSTVNNIGNGYHNYNAVEVISGGRTPQTQHRLFNTGNSGGTSFASPGGTDLFNVGYGTDNHNQILVNGRPVEPTGPVNSGGRTPQTQHRFSSTENSGGTSFVSPGGTDLFNVGYGTDNRNQILVNGRPVQPTGPVNSGGRIPQARNNARNNGAQKSDINQVYVNGQPVQPVENDGTYSTYFINDQTIHVLNSGSQKPTNRDSEWKRLYALYAQIQHITSELNRKAAIFKRKLRELIIKDQHQNPRLHPREFPKFS